MAANAQQQHRSSLKQYLYSHSKNEVGSPARRHKQQGPRQSELGSRSSSQASFIARSRLTDEPQNINVSSKSSKTKTRPVTIGSRVKLPSIPRYNTVRPKATFDSLPDEILSFIFWKLNVGDLISASQVCRRWHNVAADNLLWKQYYARFVGPTSKEKEAEIPVQQLEKSCWKNLCLRRCKVKRDQIYLKKWKQPDSYTGLKQRPELTLGKVGVRFELSFADTQGLQKIMAHSDIYWHTMSSSVRWYDLDFPDTRDIQNICVHACSPLMFYGPSKPAKDGIVQKSLIVESKGNLKDVLQKLTPFGSDEQIELFEPVKGFIVARYQVDGSIAFVTLALHYHNLISRCLCGSPDRSWVPPKQKGIEDDVDPQYGLHGYSCVLIIRNMRQKLLESKFTQLHTSRDMLGGGFASFTLVRKNDKMSHVSCIKEISFPWKTTLFKGIVKNVGILDITLLDERGEPFWTVSSTVEVKQSSDTNQFEFDSSKYCAMAYQDDVGRLDMEIGKLDDGTQYLSFAELSLSLAAINEVFKTSY